MPELKDELRALLRADGLDEPYVENQVAELFHDGGFRSRFDYFMPVFDNAAKRHLLVSGTSVGTEMQLAHEYGFVSVTGTEVVPGLVEICKRRFANRPAFNIVRVESETLPFDDETFSSVISGHIIEHTRCPFTYLREHIRVLQPGGFLFLEFPTRYHRTELHTGVPSLEWLPTPVRNTIIAGLRSRLSPLSGEVKRDYDAIRNTLKPVSRWQVSWWLRRSRGRARIEHSSVPAPGIVRLIVRKAP